MDKKEKKEKKEVKEKKEEKKVKNQDIIVIENSDTPEENDDIFCPDCSSILNPTVLTEKSFKNSEDENTLHDTPKNIEKGKEILGLYMVCSSCGYKIKKNRFSTIHFTKKVQEHNLNMNSMRIADLIFDKTYQRTMKIECVYENCPSKNDGTNPEIVLITSNKHPELGNLCTVCKNIWNKY
jgi:DNA-directed RNA polymerase subunit RPC12/RpoP